MEISYVNTEVKPAKYNNLINIIYKVRDLEINSEYANPQVIIKFHLKIDQKARCSGGMSMA